MHQLPLTWHGDLPTGGSRNGWMRPPTRSRPPSRTRAMQRKTVLSPAELLVYASVRQRGALTARRHANAAPRAVCSRRPPIIPETARALARAPAPSPPARPPLRPAHAACRLLPVGPGVRGARILPPPGGRGRAHPRPAGLVVRHQSRPLRPAVARLPRVHPAAERRLRGVCGGGARGAAAQRGARFEKPRGRPVREPQFGISGPPREAAEARGRYAAEARPGARAEAAGHSRGQQT
jgi:hypothetical protein